MATWHFRPGWLLIPVLFFLMSCASSPEPRNGAPDQPPVPASLGKPALLGADLSAGAGLQFRLADVLRAGVLGRCEPIDVSSSGFHLDPSRVGTVAVRCTLEEYPSMVLAVDFLFWYCYSQTTPAARIAGLEEGIKQLEKFNCPIFVGDLPHLATTASGPFAPRTRPTHAELEELNTRLFDWARHRPRTVILPVSEWVAEYRAGRAV